MTEFDADLIETTSSLKRLMRSFMLSSALLAVGVGGWSVAAKVDSAVVTSGTFVVQSSAQAVQHLEGGVVGAILVKDGQKVEEGQVLVRLDTAKVIADSSILERKLVELAAEKARLEAERDGAAAITAPASPVPGPLAQTQLDSALATQQTLMEERRSTRASQLSQLQEKKKQAETQIEGLGLQRQALDDQMTQASADLRDQTMLESKGLIRRPLLRQTEREVARLRGEIGDMEARLANAKSQLSETTFKIAEVTRTTRSEILTQLHNVTTQMAEAVQQRMATQDRLQRLDIRAPRAGIVHELAIHTVGGIVTAGQTLMSIIPTTEPLLVTAKVRPDEIDQVHAGQPATLRISSFKLPVAPELDGEVTNVSPDQVVEDKTGQAYFTVKIAVSPDQRDRLQGKELTPGLPTEVLIRGEARRVISYLTQPLTDKIGLAFREK